MPEKCVDASVAVKWVVKGEPWRIKARNLLRDSQSVGFTLIAPPMFEYETESVLQGLLENGALTVSEADAALAQLAAAGVQLLTHTDLVSRAREFARRFHQQRIYDALYAALADLRGCEFWTADTAFHSAVVPALPFVHHIRYYP